MIDIIGGQASAIEFCHFRENSDNEIDDDDLSYSHIMIMMVAYNESSSLSLIE